MQTNKHYIKATANKKTVSVIGGEIGGMEAVLVLKARTHLVGDSLNVGNLRTVIWRAWDVGMKI